MAKRAFIFFMFLISLLVGGYLINSFLLIFPTPEILQNLDDFITLLAGILLIVLAFWIFPGVFRRHNTLLESGGS